jgi:4-hydroxybenzoate polyprenyltransferase
MPAITGQMEATMKMRRIIGLVIFFVAIGMLIMLLIHNRFVGLLVISLLLFIGYHFFCSG